MKQLIEEQETTINFCRVDKSVSIWTSDSTMYTKLDRLCKEAPDFYQCEDIARDRDGNLLSKTYRLTDKNLLSFRTRRVNLNLSDEQRAARAESLRRIRQGATASRIS